MVGLLNLDIGGRRLVLPQPNVPGFVDSPWKALPFLTCGWWEVSGGGGGAREGEGEETVVGILNKKIIKKEKNIKLHKIQ